MEDAVLQDVKKAVCNGKEVTIPAKEITIGSWSGSGYIVTDPDTGAAGYMISGGLNGGSVSGIVTIEAILGLILAALSIAELVTGIIGLLTVLASLSIVGWIVLIVEICFLLSIIKYMSDLLYDYYEYVDGNQQLGDNIVKETETFAAMTLLCASILKILKLYGIDVTEWLSSKIMKSKPGEGAGTIGEGKGENAGKNEETGKRDEAGNGKGEETGKDEIGNGKGEEPGKSDGTGNGKSEETNKGDGSGTDENGKGDESGNKGGSGTISEVDRAKIDSWKYTPSDELYLKYKEVFDNPKYYNQTTGEINWPANDGFLSSPTDEVLQVGTRIDMVMTLVHLLHQKVRRMKCEL